MPRGDGRRIRPVNRPTVNRVAVEELRQSRLRDEAADAGTTRFLNGYGIVRLLPVPAILPALTLVLLCEHSGTRQERWHERLARQAQESSVSLHTWYVVRPLSRAQDGGMLGLGSPWDCLSAA